MTASDSTPSPSDEATPLNEFAQCHVGILSHLQAFAALPDLLEPAAQARRIAASTLAFFREAVFEHHAEEENELFPAVMASAKAGAERARVKTAVERLTREHRQIESRWAKLEPALKKVAKGQDAVIDPAAIRTLVGAYQAHARYEEEVFLPLAQTVLGRNGDHMAALGLSLHLRHAMPEVLARFGHHI